jgi:dienelactone hydrolase
MSALSLACLFAIGTTAPSAAPLWGKLEPGPFAVGFRQQQQYDHGRAFRNPLRLDGTRREGELSRPMQVSIWYPAEAGSGGGPLTMGDYLSMIPNETRFFKATPEAVDAAAQAFINNVLPGVLTPEMPGLLRTLQGRAHRDARPASGRFPVILYSLFSAPVSATSAEYLASHGYVVVTMPRIPLLAGLPDSLRSAADIDAKVRDTDFLIRTLADFSPADITNMGIVGFSAGGWWGLSQVMRNPSIRAMVSLDTVMLFDDEAKKNWKTLPYFDLDAVRVPLLHLIRKEWVPQEDRKMWEAMRYADRLSLQFQDPILNHWDFQSAGYALLLAGARKEAAGPIETSFLLYNRYTLAFFNAHLRGDAKAREWLKRKPEENGAPLGFVLAEALPAERAPRSIAEFMVALVEDGAGAVATAYREEWKRLGAPPIPEAVLNAAAYGVLLEGRTKDAMGMFELNVEVFPGSANVYDSLGDACIQAGDTKRAKELAVRTLAVLETDSSLTPERKKLIRDAAEDKLRRFR